MTKARGQWREAGARLYNQAVHRREWVAAIGLSLGVAGATLVPYLVAQSLLPGEALFGGFLLNPTDGFSYLAKMREGAEGAWLFRLPYAAEPGPGAFVFTYFLLLGHVAKTLGVPLLSVYHAARLIGGALMFLAAFALFSRVLPERGGRWSAFGLSLVGAGLGWMVLPLGVVAADLWIPELIPFLSAYANAHFPLAAAAFLGAIIAVLPSGQGPERLVQRMVLAGFSGLVLSALQPFAIVSLLIVLAGWLVWEGVRAARRGESKWWASHTGVLLPFAALIVGASPQIAYDVWVFRTYEVLGAWAAQNQTPSPPPSDYAIGLGVVGILAIVGVLKGKGLQRPEGRLLLSWAVLQAALLYAPIGLQRRLSLGWFFAIAALAGMGLSAWLTPRRRLGLGLGVALLLGLPSNLAVIGAGLGGVARQDATLVISQAEAAAYEWLSQHVAADSLVLAAADTGNRLPAFANVRVLYGHPFETPDAAAQRSLVEDLFTTERSEADALLEMRELGVNLVFFGPVERTLGQPGWLSRLPVLYDAGGVTIYEVESR